MKLPQTPDELRDWVSREFDMSRDDQAALVSGFDSVLQWQRGLLGSSKGEAIRAVSEGFSARLQRLHSQLNEKDTRTRLYRFEAFRERFETFLATEQRVTCIGVGVADINSFKNYNDTLGHAIGDRIIERVAHLLAKCVRSEDFMASDRAGASRDLHARLGGDEFCFVISNLQHRDTAAVIGNRYKRAVEAHDWATEHEWLAERPVKVDIGIVCLSLGPLAGRRAYVADMVAGLLDHADGLMYAAKESASESVRVRSMRFENGALVYVPESSPE